MMIAMPLTTSFAPITTSLMPYVAVASVRLNAAWWRPSWSSQPAD
jgi:hypothetical protein